MSYLRHSKIDLTNAASQVVNAIPSTEELVILLRGSGTLGALGDAIAIRPNSDSGANYSTHYHFASSSAGHFVGSDASTFIWLGQGMDTSFLNCSARIVRTGNHWTSRASLARSSAGAGIRVLADFVSVWNSGGVSISTLQFRFDVSTAAARFTGRLEVWYQNA